MWYMHHALIAGLAGNHRRGKGVAGTNAGGAAAEV
jgi:hypothetical protein